MMYSKNRWNDEQRELIAKYYQNMSNEELIKIFKEHGYERSKSSLDSEAHRQGIKKDNKTKRKALSVAIKTTSMKKMPATKKVNGIIYYCMPEHPYAKSRGIYYVQAKRLVAEEKLGRYLESYEIVNLIDGNEDNIGYDNIEIIHYYRHELEPLEIYKDRISGMSIKAIKEKYGISNNTYYRKYYEGLKNKWKLETNK